VEWKRINSLGIWMAMKKSSFLSIVFLLLVVRASLSLSDAFLSQVWLEEGTVYFFSARYLSFWRAVLAQDSMYVNLLPNLIAYVLVGVPGREAALELFPYLNKFINWATFSFCCALLVSQRFSAFIPSLNQRIIIALLFAAYPHLDLSLPYNSTYGAIFVFLWLGLKVERKDTVLRLLGCEFLIGFLFAFSKPVIVYAAVPYLLLSLFYAIKAKCNRSIALFVFVLCSLLLSIYLMTGVPSLDGDRIHFGPGPLLISIRRAIESILIVSNGYFSVYFLNSNWEMCSYLVIPSVFALLVCLAYARDISLKQVRVSCLGVVRFMIDRNILFLVILAAGAVVGAVLTMQKWRGGPLYGFNAFWMFNRHLFPVFVSFHLVFAALINRIGFLSFSSRKVIGAVFIFFCALQAIYSVIFYANPIPSVSAQQLRTAAEVNNPLSWQLTVPDLLGKYPCAPVSPLGGAIGCQYESERGERFESVGGEDVHIELADSGKAVRMVLLLLDESAGACQDLSVVSKSGEVVVGRRESEVSRTVIFSFRVPLARVGQQIVVRARCSSAKVSGNYFVLEV